MFYFILHPLEWVDAEDSGKVFSAKRVTQDRYVVSWMSNIGFESMSMHSEDVTKQLAAGRWIMTDEQGNY